MARRKSGVKGDVLYLLKERKPLPIEIYAKQVFKLTRSLLLDLGIFILIYIILKVFGLPIFIVYTLGAIMVITTITIGLIQLKNEREKHTNTWADMVESNYTLYEKENVKIEQDILNQLIEVNQGKGKLPTVRRLYTILTVNKKGEVILTEDSEKVYEYKELKEKVCKDPLLDKVGYNNYIETLYKIKEEKKLSEQVRLSKKRVEEDREVANQDMVLSNMYIKEYKRQHGESKLPTSLTLEKERIEQELVILNQEMAHLQEELQSIEYN